MDSRYELHMFYYFIVLLVFITLWWWMYLHYMNKAKREDRQERMLERERRG